MYMDIFIVGKIMRLFILVFCLAAFTSCVAIRDTAVYNMELMFLEKTILYQNKAVKKYLNTHCCSNGVFNATSKECGQHLDTYITIKSRMNYHTDMMRYLARIIEQKPDLPKLEIDGEGLCE